MSASAAQDTCKLRLSHLYKVYGKSGQAALELAARGVPTSQIQERTGAVVAVRDVSLSVDAGQVFVIMGLSGSGKSTLVRCVNRLIDATAGQIFIDGEETLGLDAGAHRALRRRRISMVFQNFALLPHRSVLANVEYGLAVRGDPAELSRRTALAWIDRVGLSAWADHLPHELSGGMRQRVGLARALATDSDILLMDEPFSALDPLIRRNLQDELLRLQSELHKTIVFVTHDFQEAAKLGNQVAVMREGAVVQSGPPRDLVLNPVDDYIREFTLDVDRSRVLTAADALPPEGRAGADRGDAPLDPLGPVFNASDPLQALYGPVTSGRTVAIVRPDGSLLGRVDAGDVLRILSPDREGHPPAASRREFPR